MCTFEKCDIPLYKVVSVGDGYRITFSLIEVHSELSCPGLICRKHQYFSPPKNEDNLTIDDVNKFFRAEIVGTCLESA